MAVELEKGGRWEYLGGKMGLVVEWMPREEVEGLAIERIGRMQWISWWDGVETTNLVLDIIAFEVLMGPLSGAIH